MPRKVLTEAATEPPEDGAIQVEMTLAVRQRRCKDGREQRDQFGIACDRPGIPRIARLMALAIKFQEMVDRGEVRDYADLARLGYVTRARLTQIMNLLLLAPDIQDEILGLCAGADQKVVAERHIRSVVKFVLWERQRQAWRKK